MAVTDLTDDANIVVITVCRNARALLSVAIESVRQLNAPHVRHIVIDGASTDGTAQYLASLDPPLHQWVSEPDLGIYDAMNKGWVAAPLASYILFLGADDRLLGVPTIRELRKAQASGCGIIFGTTELESTLFVSRFDKTIRWWNTLHHQSVLIRKSLSPDPPFNVRYKVYADWDFNLRLWRAGHRAIRSDSLKAFASAQGVSRTIAVAETFHIAFNNGGLWIGFGAWIRALMYWGLSHRAVLMLRGASIGSRRGR